MSLVTIPTFDDPFYTQLTTLDSTVYSLYFAYNQRENCWYISVSDLAGNLLIDGVKLVCGIPLLKSYQYIPGTPQGVLVCVTNTNDDSPPGLEDLVDETGRCALIYLEVGSDGTS